VLECPRCGGRLGLLALIEQARTVERILRHFGLLADRPEAPPARAPPLPTDDPSRSTRRCDRVSGNRVSLGCVSSWLQGAARRDHPTVTGASAANLF
jgi:hypothetical protein